MRNDSPAQVVGQDGSSRSLGDYLKELKARSSIKVTQLAADAGISRANYYLLESDKQRPSLTTAIALLAVLGVEARVPSPEDPDLAKDLDLVDGGTSLALRINWPPEERRRSREKFWTSAGAGFAPWGAVGIAAAAAGFLPAAIPLAGVAVAAKLLHERSKERTGNKPDAPTGEAPDGNVMSDFAKAAEDMSTEELETLLEAMKAMRAERDDSGPT